ncbi:MAG TPA: DUF262 domain-containing HNH endonuclease family protein [Candidatus Acidoferrum sp.]|nr:DUF262 domain-containing HNH endonuclease family protein [Candidatus Acidoferrum sp.]
MIEPKYQTLNALFADRVFQIPKYQRFYSWQKKQREDLFGDIRELAKKGEDRHHFMATIVCFRTRDIKSFGSLEYRMYDIVDGQQRLTTLILIMKAIQKRLEEGEEKKDISKILVKGDGNLLLLQTNNANQQLFNDYLKNGKSPSKDKIKTYADRNLRDAIQDCERFVSVWLEEGKDLMALLRLLRNRLGFVVYDTDDNTIVYSVFEVLNSRGLEVDWLDKSKSALMGRAFELSKSTAAATAKIDELNALWGKIYERLALEPVAGHEVLRVAATIRLGDEAGKPLKAETALKKFREFCNDAEKTTTVSTWLYDNADTLVKLQKNRYWEPVVGILQARVLAVSLMLTDTLTESEREKALDQWQRVTFRIYGLFGRDSRSKVGDYVRLANNMMNRAEGAKRYSEIMASLRKLGEDYPIEAAVAEGLSKKNCYEGFAEETRYILWHYEEHLAESAGAQINKEIREEIWQERSASDTIEHIFPQSPEPGGAWEGKLKKHQRIETHVHRIGNLILLAEPLNEEARRKGFSEKKNIYAKSEGLRMVKEVMNEKDWRQQEIEKRENKIIEWAKTAWADLPD